MLRYVLTCHAPAPSPQGSREYTYEVLSWRTALDRLCADHYPPGSGWETRGDHAFIYGPDGKFLGDVDVDFYGGGAA